MLKQSYRYFAFVSYSRKNSRAAAFVQRRLEHFRIPLKHVAVENRPTKGRFVRPIFRDKRDLGVSEGSFTGEIRRALEESRYLLVICSRAASSSKWVNEEIKHFLASHGNDLSLVVPIVLEGNPGGGTDGECLPESLRDAGLAALGIDGRMTERNLPTMIPDEGAKEIEGWENGVVQTLSYLLKVNRESIKASIDAERVRQMKIYAIIAAVCTCVFAGLAVWAVRAERRADANRQIAEANEGRAVAGERAADEKRKLAEQTLRFVQRMLQEGKPDEFGPKNIVDLLTEQVSKVDLLNPPELKYAVATLIGQIMCEQAMHRPAEELLGKSVDYYRSHKQWREFNDAANSLAVIYSMTGREKESLSLQDEIAATPSMQSGTEISQAVHLHNIAVSYANSGNSTSAWEYCVRSQKKVGDRKCSIAASILCLHATLLIEKGDCRGALDSLRKAVDMDASDAGRNSGLFLRMSEAHYQLAEYPEARRQAETGVKIEKNTRNGRPSGNLAGLYNMLGLIDSAEGRSAEALMNFELAVQTFEALKTKASRGSVKMYNNLGMQYAKIGNLERARMIFEKALSDCEERFGKGSADTYFPLLNLGYLAAQRKSSYKIAHGYYERAKAAVIRHQGPDHADLYAVYNNLSSLDLSEGNYSSALLNALEAQRIARQNGNESKSNMVHSLINAADAYRRLGMRTEALHMASNAVWVAKATLPPGHVDRQACMIAYETVSRGVDIMCNAVRDTDALKREAKRAIELNENEKAERLYQQLASLQTAGGGNFSSDYAFFANQLGVLAARKELYADALSKYFEAIRIEEKVQGKGSVELPMYYFNAGMSQAELANHHEAIRWFEKSLGAWMSRTPVNSNQVSECHTRLGRTYAKMENRAKAAEHFLEAVKIDSALHGPTNVNVAVDHEDLANCYDEMGRYEDAVDGFRKALRIREQLGKLSPEKKALIVNRLGNAYDHWGKYELALECHKKNYEMDVEIFGKTNRQTVVALGNLGDSYRKVGDFTNAVRCLESALKLKLTLPEFTPKQVAMAYNDLGIGYDDAGEYDKAVRAYRQALEIDLCQYGRENREVMVVYGNLAISHKNAGALDEECECRRKALDIALLLYGETSSEVLEKYENMADCLSRMGKREKCIAMRTRVVEILRKAKGRESMATAKALNLLGEAQYGSDDYVSASQSYREALQIYAQGGQDFRESVAAVASNLGFSEMNSDRYPEAIRAFEQAMRIVREDRMSVSDDSDLGSAARQIALCRKRMGSWPVVRIAEVEAGKEGARRGARVGDIWCAIGKWKAEDSKAQRRDVFWKAAQEEWNALNGTNRTLTVLRKSENGWKCVRIDFATSDAGFTYEISDMPKGELDAAARESQEIRSMP